MHGSVGAGTTGLGLNAPSGAGCFLTERGLRAHSRRRVIMHLMVLGAF